MENKDMTGVLFPVVWKLMPNKRNKTTHQPKMTIYRFNRKEKKNG